MTDRNTDFQVLVHEFIDEALKLPEFKTVTLIDVKTSQSTESVYAIFYDSVNHKASCVRISDHIKPRKYYPMPEFPFSNYDNFTDASNELLNVILNSKGGVEINERTILQFNSFNQKVLKYGLTFDGKYCVYTDGEIKLIRNKPTMIVLNRLRRLSMIFLTQFVFNNSARAIVKINNFSDVVSKLAKEFLKHKPPTKLNVNTNHTNSQTRPMYNMLLVVQVNTGSVLVKSSRRVRHRVSIGAKVCVMDTKNGGRIVGVCKATYCVSRNDARSVSNHLVAVQVKTQAPLLIEQRDR